MINNPSENQTGPQRVYEREAAAQAITESTPALRNLVRQIEAKLEEPTYDKLRPLIVAGIREYADLIEQEPVILRGKNVADRQKRLAAFLDWENAPSFTREDMSDFVEGWYSGNISDEREFQEQNQNYPLGVLARLEMELSRMGRDTQGTPLRVMVNGQKVETTEYARVVADALDMD